MAYFPFFMELSGTPGLIAGGGTVALRKIEKLLPYGPRLTVCAPEILPEIRQIPGLELLEQPFSEDLLESAAFAIAATGDRTLNHRISELCRTLRIPVNVVDDREACSFVFPALVKRGDLSIGISTGGTSPSAAIYVKKLISGLIPEQMDGLLAYLDGLRPLVKAAVPEESRRSSIFTRLFQLCLEQGWPLEPEQFQQLLSQKEESP